MVVERLQELQDAGLVDRYESRNPRLLQNHGIPKRWKMIAVTAVVTAVGDCALCALEVISDKVTERGVASAPSRRLCC